MYPIPQNYVKIAVDRIGGVTKSANAMAVSGTTIHAWIKQGRIVNIDRAKQMAALSGVELKQLRSTC